jgi:hypothetical protein
MSKEQQKYKREQKIITDKQQIRLDTLDFMKSPLVTEQIELKLSQIVICPFCLYRSILEKFLFSCGKGLHKSLGFCPDCGNKATFRTLIKMPTWTPQEYAKFVFDYVQNGFWDKCNYGKWSTRMKLDLEICNAFWEKYKLLKGEKQENYEEY